MDRFLTAFFISFFHRVESSMMRTSSSPIPAPVFSAWRMRVLVPTDRSLYVPSSGCNCERLSIYEKTHIMMYQFLSFCSSFARLRLRGWTESTLFSDPSWKAWMWSVPLKESDPAVVPPRPRSLWTTVVSSKQAGNRGFAALQ